MSTVTAATLETLRQFALLSTLEDADFQELLPLIRPFRCAAGEVLFSEGDRSDGVYLITQGTVEVSTVLPDTQRPVVIRSAGRGDVLGEVALVDGLPRSASAHATANAAGLRLDTAAFGRLRAQQRPVARRLLWQIGLTTCARLRSMTDRLERGSQRVAQPQGSTPGARVLPQIPAGTREQLSAMGHLSAFRPHELDALLGIARVLSVPSGGLICREDDVGASAFILLSGTVEVLVRRHGRTEGLATLQAGAMFGQVALLDGGLRSATCRARGECRVLELGRSGLVRLLDAGDAAGFRLLDGLCVILAGQLRRATQQLRRLEGWMHQRRLDSTAEGLRRASSADRSLQRFLREAQLGLGDFDPSEISFV